MEILRIVLEAIGGVAGLLLMFSIFYQIVIGLFGFKKETKDYADHEPESRFLVLIPAHNEERVIGQLLDSIAMQEYPAELIHVFVVADNCSDHTAAVARARGATVYERADPDHQTKGYALQFLFRQIEFELFCRFLIFLAEIR